MSSNYANLSIIESRDNPHLRTVSRVYDQDLWMIVCFTVRGALLVDLGLK